jgi:Bacterial inner membrane protein
MDGLPLTLANLCGATAVTLGCAWPFLGARRAILICQSIGAAAFALHFLLLGSGTGAVMCAVSLVQALAATWRVRRAVLVAIFALTVAVAGWLTWATWHGVPSICAAVGLLFATLGRLLRDGQRMRYAFFGSSTAWVGHNLLMGSAFGLTCDTLTLTSLVVGLRKHRRRGDAFHDTDTASVPCQPRPANDREESGRHRRYVA